MNRRKFQLRISQAQFDTLYQHLFCGDGDEHGAVLRAGLCEQDGQVRLLVREVSLAVDGIDYVKGRIGHRALLPQFIHRQICACRDQRQVYLAVHNHGSSNTVAFSPIDMCSHERGYPALLDIAKGMPVGALVLGTQSMQADLWMPNGERLELESCVIIGRSIRRLKPRPTVVELDATLHDRQLRMFGKAGQAVLRASKIAVVGLGGAGSIMAEHLARLGVGRMVLIDDDAIEDSNLSRVVGATLEDASMKRMKVEIAHRHLLEAAPELVLELVDKDVALSSVARRLRDSDYIFLAADSMRARLVVNALVHQYLVPATQVGAKVRANDDFSLAEAMSVVRHLRPSEGCLWCNGLIDPTRLAIEAKTDAERQEQAYGVQEANPSVISLNAIATAHAINDFLFDFLGLRQEERPSEYVNFHHLSPVTRAVKARRDGDCRECGTQLHSRYARGDQLELPTLPG